MKTLKSIRDGYVNKYSSYIAKRDILERKIAKAQTERGELRCPAWVDEIIRPIAEEVIKHFPGRTYDILGPFGLGARVSMHLYKKGVSDKRRFEKNNCISVTFEPKDLDKGAIEIVNYSRNTKRFSKGTIAEINGFNYPTRPIKGIEDIIKTLKTRKGK